jgi:glycosyltransferase involved in cell wall biosynthesis
MRISIITLALDHPRHLDEALASVKDDPSIELEHIIVHDGDDGSFERLARQYPRIRFIRGGAAGATAAAALGVRSATGDFILLLHSDDRLMPGALQALAAAAAADTAVRIWSGGLRIFSALPDGREVTIRRLSSREETRLSLSNICDDIPLLTARFVHRSVYADIGNFNPAFPESSDREFLLRAVMANVPEAPLGVAVSDMRMHDESRTVHRRSGWVPPYLAEHLLMADAWLGRPDLDPAARRFLRNWRARESLRLAIYQMRTGHWRDALVLLGYCIRSPTTPTSQQ